MTIDTGNDMEMFDKIVSGERDAEIAMPEPEVKIQEPVRDEAGKFAKAEPAAEDKTPVVATPEAEGPVPVAAVQDERRKRQNAELRADELERRLAALETAKPASAAPVAQQQAPDFWNDPQSFITGALTPLQQENANLREMIMESRAEAVHGADKVAAAREAAEKLIGTPEAAALHQELSTKPGNLFSNLVSWHARQQTLATVGNDPQAWLQAELDKKMADPAFQAQVMAQAKATAAPVVQGRSNAPRVSLPSLSNIPASGNAPEGQSDMDAFASITARRR